MRDKICDFNVIDLREKVWKVGHFPYDFRNSQVDIQTEENWRRMSSA